MKSAILSAAMCVMMAASAHAATLLTQTTAPNRNNFDGTIGYRILVGASDISVTALGFQDAGGDGLSSSHNVGIWGLTENTMMASVVVPSGTVEALESNYRYVRAFGLSRLYGTGLAVRTRRSA